MTTFSYRGPRSSKRRLANLARQFGIDPEEAQRLKTNPSGVPPISKIDPVAHDVTVTGHNLGFLIMPVQHSLPIAEDAKDAKFKAIPRDDEAHLPAEEPVRVTPTVTEEQAAAIFSGYPHASYRETSMLRRVWRRDQRLIARLTDENPTTLGHNSVINLEET